MNDKFFVIGNRLSNKYGMVDSYGKIVIQKKYTSFVVDTLNCYVKVTDYEKYPYNQGIISFSGKTLLEPIYKIGSFYNEDFSRTFRKDTKDDYANSTKEFYKKSKIKSRDFAEIQDSKGNFGVVNKQGKIIVPIIFEEINFPNDRYESILLRGFILKEVVPTDEVKQFIIASKNDYRNFLGQCLYDDLGNIVVEPREGLRFYPEYFF